MREFLRFYVLEDAFYVHFTFSIMNMLESVYILYLLFSFTILKRSKLSIIKDLRLYLKKDIIVHKLVFALAHFLLVGFFYVTADKSFIHNYTIGQIVYYVAILLDILTIILTLKIKKKISKKE